MPQLAMASDTQKPMAYVTMSLHWYVPVDSVCVTEIISTHWQDTWLAPSRGTCHRVLWHLQTLT